MRLTALHCRRTVVAVLAALLIIGALWWGLWTLAASQLRSSIDGWIASGRAAGYTIAYDDQQMFGFPHHVVLRFSNLNWKNTDGIVFHADQLDLSSIPWEREVFAAGFRGHAEISAPLDTDGKSLTLSGENGHANVVLDTDGVWKFSRISLEQAKLGRAPDALFLAEKLEATAERPKLPPKDHTQPGLTLNGHAENMTLPAAMPAPFGLKMADLQLAVRVMGDMPDFRKRDSVEVWNTGSGVVEFDSLHMDWGPLRMNAKGTLGFDDDLQPEGAFSSAIGNHDEVLKDLLEKGYVAQRQAGMLNSAIALFAKPSGGAKADINVPITIQLGGLFLGPVRIFVFPEIQWPKAGSPPDAAPMLVPVPPPAK